MPKKARAALEDSSAISGSKRRLSLGNTELLLSEKNADADNALVVNSLARLP
jgi:hypothetical protein